MMLLLRWLTSWSVFVVVVITITTASSFLDIVVTALIPSTLQVNKVTASRFRSTSTYARTNHDTSISDTANEILHSASSYINRELSVNATTEPENISNPYTSGCLHMKELVSQIRVCNSEDPLDASTSGTICQIPNVDYMEIRIFADNWDSVTFEAWILQIILSELLDVPTTIEAGSYEGSLNFYHPDAPMEYGTSLSDNDALIFAYGIGDCRNVNKESTATYKACAHFEPERWTGMFGPY